MKVSPMSKPVVDMATAGLKSGIPELTPEILLSALRAYQKDEEPSLPKLLTVKEVQESLSVSHRFVYRLFQSGELKKVKLGKATRIPLDSFNQYLMKVSA